MAVETNEEVKPKRRLDRTAKEEPEEISLEDDEEQEEETPEPAAAGPSRAEKKRDRFRALKDEIEGKLREETDARVRAEARAAAVETNWRLEQDRRQREEQAGREDPYAKKDKELADEQQRLVDQFEAHQRAGTLTADTAKAIRERAVEVQKQRMDNHLDRKLQSRGTPQDVVTSQNVGQHVTQAYIRANYPDVLNDRGAHMYAMGILARKVQREKKPDTQETLDEAMAETREQYLGQRSTKPSQAQRRGATGVSVGGGGGGATGAPKTYAMTTDEKKMARAMYKNLPEADAYKKWVREVKPYEKDE